MKMSSSRLSARCFSSISAGSDRKQGSCTYSSTDLSSTWGSRVGLDTESPPGICASSQIILNPFGCTKYLGQMSYKLSILKGTVPDGPADSRPSGNLKSLQSETRIAHWRYASTQIRWMIIITVDMIFVWVSGYEFHLVLIHDPRILITDDWLSSDSSSYLQTHLAVQLYVVRR